MNPATLKKTAKPCLSRRCFVKLSAASALAVGTAHAQEKEPEAPWAAFKATKEAAAYFEKPGPSPQDCSTCHSYIEPADCLLVEAPVSPWGWCNYYSD
jgi:hypothetical protein